MTEHPITPSPKLVHKWCEIWNESDDEDAALLDYISVRAAQWGADQELEACCEWMEAYDYDEVGRQLAELMHAARRPKPPSLKEQALMAINAIDAGTDRLGDSDIIRRALEALPND